MLSIKRSKCVVLPLVLMGHWYDAIEMGAKDEEYRTATKVIRMIQRWRGEAEIEDKHAVVEFRRGYRADAPRMSWLVAGVSSRGAGCCAHPEMGEPSDKPHYAIVLCERIELEDDQ
ncbi:MAG: hypothetical protein IJL17_21665 [Kiritimatiellae bacterium]|nr:hypothetical protein [Kiritimatiellia bacterium]